MTKAAHTPKSEPRELVPLAAVVIVEMLSKTDTQRLPPRQPDVVGAVVVVEDLEADLVAIVAHAKRRSLPAAASQQPEVAADPDDLVDVPKHPVALDEARLGTTAISCISRRHRLTISHFVSLRNRVKIVLHA